MQLKKYMPNLIAPHISPYSHFVRTTCINITVPNARASHILMSKKQTDFTSALNPNNQFIKSNMLISPLIHITDTHCLLNRRNNSQIPERCPQTVCSQYLTRYQRSEISMSAYKTYGTHPPYNRFHRIKVKIIYRKKVRLQPANQNEATVFPSTRRLSWHCYGSGKPNQKSTKHHYTSVPHRKCSAKEPVSSYNKDHITPQKRLYYTTKWTILHNGKASSTSQQKA